MPAGGGFAFGPFRLDPRARRLTRDGVDVRLAARQFLLLHALVSRTGEPLSKDVLMQAAWQDVAVGDNSLEQAISQLRRSLDATEPNRFIETVPRRGYRFVAPVTRVTLRETDAALDELVAPYRALVEGRAAIETLERGQIAQARVVFAQALAHHPDEPMLHVGLANACVLQFEMTRAEAVPDVEALALAARHAREACRLDANYAEAWATLGFVLDRTADRAEALPALLLAVKLEPESWRHTLRLASVSWGEARLRAARRTLALMPGLALGHLLVATVYIARGMLADAEREIDAGLAAVAAESSAPSRFSAVALHWLKGLLCLARGDHDEAMTWLERELARESRGHLYARECCAHAWYAIGACQLRRGNREAARDAFDQAIARVPLHPMAHAGLTLLDARGPSERPPVAPSSIEATLEQAALLVAAGKSAEAGRRVAVALAAATSANAGWLVPIEPLLGVEREGAVWAEALSVLRMRAG